MKKYILSAVILILSLPVFSQTIRGFVYDAQSSEPLLGVNIIYRQAGELKGVTTDNSGFYSIALPAGSADLTFTYVGYEDEQVILLLSHRETVEKDVYMRPGTKLMEEVVVSAGRFEQRLSEITVSMDVLKASDISKQSPTDLSQVLKTLPGVDINDKQPSIRGGSGWTYGVGSRSLILVDGMSILNPGTGEINWNTIPIENVEQVEVLKGASSVLYGSSALNGLINVRTSRPGLTPQTTVNLHTGIYGNPSNEDYIWWDKSLWSDGKYDVQPFLRRSILAGIRNPLYEGFDISHTRRIGNFDVSGGVDLFTDEGFRQGGYNKRFRFGGNLTYHQPGVNIVNYGMNLNVLTNQYGDFFIWRSPLEPYRSSPFTTMAREGNSVRIDPFYNFNNTSKNSSHKVKARFFYRGENIVNKHKAGNIADILGNMGTDLGTITDMIGNIQNGDISSIAPIIPPLAEGNLNGVVDGAFNLLGQLFPSMTTADLCDLIGWFMQNGIPSSMADLVPWASGVLSPRTDKTVVDKFYTYYVDYQYGKEFDGGARITAGTTFEHNNTKSVTTGDHNSDNVAVYLQYDQRFFDRLSVSVGTRMEYYRVDKFKREAETSIFGTSIPVKPIFRGGINYQLAEYSFLRASFGQGYRYPSLTEKYARRDVGGVGVFPSPDIKAEQGINAEVGIKQGYKIGAFQGFLDVAAFYTQYKNMIEFRFGIFDNDNGDYINSTSQMISMIASGHMPGIGANFYNVSKARIYGVEISTNGLWTINRNIKMLYNLGYVFIEPQDVDYKKKNETENGYTDPLEMKEKSNRSKYLKYRQKHTVKGTFDFQWNRVSLGFNMSWKSKTLAVDYLMVDDRPKPYGKHEVMDYVRDILFGDIDGQTLSTYWDKHNKSYFLMDMRFGVTVTKKVQFQFSVENLFNKEYSTRPMAVGMPRTFVTQVKLTF